MSRRMRSVLSFKKQILLWASLWINKLFLKILRKFNRLRKKSNLLFKEPHFPLNSDLINWVNLFYRRFGLSDLLVVSGRVGSGKTSLLLSIMDETN